MCYLLTPSVYCIYWLKTTKPLSIFVKNRVKEIKSLTGVTYAHVPSQHNPADIATRGKSPDKLTSSIWWKGPIWLAKPVQPNSRFTDKDRLRVRLKVAKASMKLNLFMGRIPLENLLK